MKFWILMLLIPGSSSKGILSSVSCHRHMFCEEAHSELMESVPDVATEEECQTICRDLQCSVYNCTVVPTVWGQRCASHITQSCVPDRFLTMCGT